MPVTLGKGSALAESNLEEEALEEEVWDLSKKTSREQKQTPHVHYKKIHRTQICWCAHMHIKHAIHTHIILRLGTPISVSLRDPLQRSRSQSELKLKGFAM